MFLVWPFAKSFTLKNFAPRRFNEYNTRRHFVTMVASFAKRCEPWKLLIEVTNKDGKAISFSKIPYSWDIILN